MDGERVLQLIDGFFKRSSDDVKVTAAHISLYISLLQLARSRCAESFVIFSYDVMPICKISSSSTYHRVIRELSEYGYIRYIPSYNRFRGSQVSFFDKL